MRSTFMGLEVSKRGIFTQQSALYTTGHNIANANTEGYSRQRVNMETTEGFPGTGLNAPKTAGYIGTGVQASSVQRIRDEFIDRQYRQESSKLGYWESKTKAISQMEDLMNEPSKYGISAAFDTFWKSLEDVSTSPESAASRQVAVSRAESLAETFNYMDIQLKQVQRNLGNELNVSTTQINSILKQIAAINEQVQEVEPNGYMPNDLYDSRDKLVDQLSEYLPISVSSVPSGGNALAIAEGSLTISYKKKDGTTIDLVNSRQYVALSTTGTNDRAVDDTDLSNVFLQINVSALGLPPTVPLAGSGASTIGYTDMEQTKGGLLALIDAYGFATLDATGAVVQDVTTGNAKVNGYYPEMLAKLDQLADTFVTVFNAVHSAGFTNDQTTTTGQAFFDTTQKGAAGMKVSADIIANPNLFAASSGPGEEGNGKWAIELANLQSKHLGSAGFTIDLDATDPSDANIVYDGSMNLDNATFKSFYQSIIGKLGVDGQESIRFQATSKTLQLAITNNRASISSVSLDEEMTNMITFQQAYNANARMITVVDEILDKIINGMGRAGL